MLKFLLNSCHHINLFVCHPDALCIVLAGKIRAVCRARDEHTPKSTADLTVGQAWCINVASQVALEKALNEVGAIDFVAVYSSHEYRKVVVAVCSIS